MVTPDSLLPVLSRALSDDAALRDPASAELDGLTHSAGFLASLAHVLQDGAVTDEARTLAAVLLRQCIDRVWRSVGPEEAAAVRESVMASLASPVFEGLPRVADLFAGAVGRMARYDLGAGSWDALLPSLVALLEDPPHRTAFVNALLAFYFVTEELVCSRKRGSASGRRRDPLLDGGPVAELLGQLSVELIPRLAAVWSDAVGSLVADDKDAVVVVLYTTRILSKLVVYGAAVGAQQFGPDSPATHWLAAILETLPPLVDLASALDPVGEARQTLTAILEIAAVPRHIMVSHPVCFAPIAAPFVRYTYDTLLHIVSDIPFFSSFVHDPPFFFRAHLILLMQFAGASLDYLAFLPPEDDDGAVPAHAVNALVGHGVGGGGGGGNTRHASMPWRRSPAVFAASPLRAVVRSSPHAEAALLAAGQQLHDFLFAETDAYGGDTGTRLLDLLGTLTTRVLVLTQGELEEWSEDPEAYILRMDALNAEVDLRPAAEALVVQWLKSCTGPVTGSLLSMLSSAVSAGCADLDDVLLKDLAYRCVGIGSWELADEVPFDEWFVGGLVPEATGASPYAPILTARVLLLIEHWVPAFKNDKIRAVAYELITRVLGESSDMVSRVCAANAAWHLVNDWDFEQHGFVDYAPATLEGLLRIVADADNSEHKLLCIRTVSLILERMGGLLRGLAGSLADTLPDLWTVADEFVNLQPAVVNATIKVVKALGSLAPAALDAFVVPLIEHCTAPTPRGAYLMDEGLTLWEEYIKVAVPPLEGDLLALLERAAELAHSGLGELVSCVKILESYVILGGGDLVEAAGELIASALVRLVAYGRNDDGLSAVLPVMTTMVVVAPGSAPQLLGDFLARAVNDVVGNRVRASVFPKVMCLLCRVCLVQPEFFSSLFTTVGGGDGAEQALGAFLDAWLASWDDIDDAFDRKLNAMALASLLDVHSVSLPRFSRFLGALLAVLYEGVSDSSSPNGNSNGNGNGNGTSASRGFDAMFASATEVLDGVSKSTHASSVRASILALDTTHPDADSAAGPEPEAERRAELWQNDELVTTPLRDYVAAQLESLQASIGRDGMDQLLGSTSDIVREQFMAFWES